MGFSEPDRKILRDQAKQVADIAAEPVMEQRRRLWCEHNSLRSKKPMLLTFPEGAWEELMPGSLLRCEDGQARGIEGGMRSRIYAWEHFADDTVVEAEYVVGPVMESTGWGLEPKWHPSDVARGAWGFDPVLKDASDLKKLRHPELTYDEKATRERIEFGQDLFGDVLDVKFKGTGTISYHLPARYVALRGLTETMMDMVDQPNLIHDVMAFFEEGHRRHLQQLVDLNLLALNNDNTYQNSGGNSYTDELPAEGFDPDRVRPCDIWASAEAQELAQVSPEMHEEFALQYEKRLLEPFGLTGYGCCENLTLKLDYVFQIPHIRRISIAPWADVDACAEKLKGNYIFSWKPNPSHLVGNFDPHAIREYIRHTMEVSQANGCVLEMVLKDTHTVEHRPERFDIWMQTARELIEETV